MANILNVSNLEKHYSSGSKDLTVLDGVSFEIESGETFSIVGPSGSGKTTLLGLCAGLDQSDTGTIELCGENLMTLSEDERALLRNRKVGFIFQDFQLLPTLTALENVSVPMELQGIKDPTSKALSLLEKVGLADRSDHYPSQLSGGEQQRVALARALLMKPKLVLADEPTGNLDSQTSESVQSLFFDLNRRHGTTFLIVTHSRDFAAMMPRQVSMKDGRIVSDERRSKPLENQGNPT